MNNLIGNLENIRDNLQNEQLNLSFLEYLTGSAHIFSGELVR